MRILFAGGGTAGHINPAVAIANYISEREDLEAAFVGTKEGLEAELIPRLGHELYIIKFTALREALICKTLRTSLSFPKAL